jgi:hypothetical protein
MSPPALASTYMAMAAKATNPKISFHMVHVSRKIKKTLVLQREPVCTNPHKADQVSFV